MGKRPGKYDAVMHKLPKFDKVPFQDRVEVEKTNQRKCQHCKGTGKILNTGEIETTCEPCSGKVKLTATTLAMRYAKLRSEKDVAEALVSRINLEIEAVSQMLIVSQEQAEPEWGAFGAADNAVRLTNGDGIRLQPEIYPVVTDKRAFRNWCVGENIAPALDASALGCQLELPPKPLTDLVKDRLLRALPEPDGIKVFVKTKVVYSPLETETAEQPVETF